MGNRFKLNENALNSLQEFENNLNPQDPEAGAMNPKIIGYGKCRRSFVLVHQNSIHMPSSECQYLNQNKKFIPIRKHF
jgi:hypothetical protein